MPRYAFHTCIHSCSAVIHCHSDSLSRSRSHSHSHTHKHTSHHSHSHSLTRRLYRWSPHAINQPLFQASTAHAHSNRALQPASSYVAIIQHLISLHCRYRAHTTPS